MAYSGNNYQTRINQDCCDGWEHKMSNGQWMCGKEHGVCENNMSYGYSGGRLIGPSHERGGVPAIVGGHGPIELEGGEYIMNAQTTRALGLEFLDKLNSTATAYHQGGFQQGQLPSPSMYADGGKIPNRRNKMRRGRKPAKRMVRGGVARKPAKRMVRGNVARKPARAGAIRTRKASPNRQLRAGGGKRVYQQGGGVRKFANGGGFNSRQGQSPNCPNSQYHPQNIYFLQTAPDPAGETKYFCCPTRTRTEECNGYDKIAHLGELIVAKTARTTG